MADEVDVANDLVNSSVYWALKKMNAHLSPGKGSAICLDCGIDMPKERREWGFKYCVDCATERERDQAQYSNER